MEENGNKKKTLIIVLIILIILTIGLLLFKNNNSKGKNKTLSSDTYIIEKETDYYEEKGVLPIINLKGEDVENINNEIITNYYSIVNNEGDTFQYESYLYNDILSLLVTITYDNNTEYGDIKYYAYNINISDSKQLSNDELLSYLKLNNSDITEKINTQIKTYYNQDELKTTISFEEYQKQINYQDSNNNLIIKDNYLYCYNTLTPTQSLINYQGNINEIKVVELKNVTQ